MSICGHGTGSFEGGSCENYQRAVTQFTFSEYRFSKTKSKFSYELFKLFVTEKPVWSVLAVIVDGVAVRGKAVCCIAMSGRALSSMAECVMNGLANVSGKAVSGIATCVMSGVATKPAVDPATLGMV